MIDPAPASKTDLIVVFTSERHKRKASQWVIFVLPGTISSQEPLEAVEVCQHGSLRPLNSNMRSEVI